MALDEDELNVVIDAMDEKKFPAEVNVITEGEKGEHLYVVEAGTLAVYKTFVRIYCANAKKARRKWT